MPDMTMCTSRSCKKREECYRAMAKPDRIQSYGDFTKVCADKNYQCIWKIEPSDLADVEVRR